MKEYKVFEGRTVKEELSKLLGEGYFPLNLKEVYDWKKKNKDKRWFDTSTVYIKGIVRTAALKEIKNIENFYVKGVRIVFAGGNGSSNLIGDNDLSNNGRFVGVKNKIRKNKKAGLNG